MIRNLNQLTFQSFGTVPPERARADKNTDKEKSSLLSLSPKEATLYRAGYAFEQNGGANA